VTQELLSLLGSGGMEIRVTNALPFRGTDPEGKDLGPVHWLPMFDFVWVSQELYDQIKASLPMTQDIKPHATKPQGGV
jgi:hypothetical protein